MDSTKPKRGLSALLASTTQIQPTQPSAMAGNDQAPVISSSISSADVPLSSIRPNPTQPRTYFDPEALKDLSASIKARGLIQPVVLRQLRPEEATAEVRY